MIIQMLHC